jgi:hypothetical protein
MNENDQATDIPLEEGILSQGENQSESIATREQ